MPSLVRKALLGNPGWQRDPKITVPGRQLRVRVAVLPHGGKNGGYPPADAFHIAKIIQVLHQQWIALIDQTQFDGFQGLGIGQPPGLVIVKRSVKNSIRIGLPLIV